MAILYCYTVIQPFGSNTIINVAVVVVVNAG